MEKITAKKSLGQHFLRSRAALFRMAAAAELSPEDNVLEIGPGRGELTALLLEKAGKVVAVEKDDRLIPLLRQKFRREIAAGKLELIRGDILKFPINAHFSKKPYKVVANLPYYITGNFLRRFLQTERAPERMTLLLQKEVAQRIVAARGRESVLSISVKAYGQPRVVGVVKAGSFSPPPKVDSAILAIERISKEFFLEPSTTTRSDLVQTREEHFFALLKKGFAHPRKLLASNLGVPREWLRARGIRENARAEELSLAEWGRLVSDKRSAL